MARELTRPLTEAQLTRLRTKAQFAVKNAFERIVRDPTGNKVKLKESTDIKTGTHQLVLPIGAVKVGAAKRAFVLKIPKGDAPFEVKQGNLRSSGAWQEVNYLVFRNLGFPVNAHYHIGATYKRVHGIICEDLTANGMTLEEAHEFNFKKLKNGKELQTKLDAYVKQLEGMHLNKQLKVWSHASEEKQELPFVKAFHVQFSPKTMKGKIVMADLDHLLITPSKFPREIKQFNKPYDENYTDNPTKRSRFIK